MNSYQQVLRAISAGEFNVGDYSLLELSNAFFELTNGYRRARRLRLKPRKQAALAELAHYAQPLVRAIARKWAEKGREKLEWKINDLARKESDPHRALNPYDSVFLELLKEELAALRKPRGRPR